jgi:hypothetical protein
MNSALHFLHIYHLGFYLKKKPCLQTLRRFFGVTSLSRYLFVEIVLYQNQDGICFLWDLGFESWLYSLPILTLWHIVGLSTQFLLTSIWAPHQKLFSSPSIVIVLQSEGSLQLRFFLQTINIVRYNILDLEVEKHHFILIFSPHVNKYIF